MGWWQKGREPKQVLSVTKQKCLSLKASPSSVEDFFGIEASRVLLNNAFDAHLFIRLPLSGPKSPFPQTHQPTLLRPPPYLLICFSNHESLSNTYFPESPAIPQQQTQEI